MTREEFTGLFLGYIIKKAPSWLPEESTETDMLDIMQQRLGEHYMDIQKVVYKNGKNGDKRRIDD